MKSAGQGRGKRWRMLFAGIVVLLPVVGAGWWYATVSSKDLLAKSHVLLDPGPLPKAAQMWVQGWLSEHEVLCCVERTAMSFDYLVLDTRTGQRRALPALSASQRKLPGRPGTVSPDGRWMLGSSRSLFSQEDDRYRTEWQLDVSGDRMFRLRTTPDELTFFWSSDSKHCLAWDRKANSIVRWPIAASGPVERRKHLGSFEDLEPIAAYGDNLVFVNGPDPQDVCRVYQLNWSGPTQKRLMCTIALHKNGSLDRIILSPDGARIAWREYYYVSHAYPPWQQWVYDRLRMGNGTVMAVCTSHLDGSDRKEVAHINLNFSSASTAFTYWGWDFHGKEIWFEYNGRFLSVPAD
jgi:hypothetical protein